MHFFGNCTLWQALKKGKNFFLFLRNETFLAKKCKNIKISQNLFIRFFLNFMWWRAFEKIKGQFRVRNWYVSYFLFPGFVFSDSFTVRKGVLCYFALVFRRVVIGGIAASTARAIIETPLELAKVSNPEFLSFHQDTVPSKVNRKKKNNSSVS